MRLRTLILSILFLFTFVPVVGLLSLNFPTILAKFEKSAQDKQLSILRQEFLVLNNLMLLRQESLRDFSINPGSRELATSTIGNVPIDIIRNRFGSMMMDRYQADADIFHVTIYDGSGNEQLNILRNDNGLLQLIPVSTKNNASDKPIFTEGMKLKAGEVYVGGIKHEKSPEKEIPETIVQLGVTISARKGVSKGVGIIEFDLTDFLIDYDDHIILLGDGTYIHSPKRKTPVSAMPREAYADFAKLEPILNNNEAAIAYDYSGNAMAFMPLIIDWPPKHSLWVGHYVDVSEVTEWVKLFQTRLLCVLGVLFLVSFLIARKIANRMDTIIHNLVSELSGLLQHESNMDLQWGWPRELKQLGHDLNTLSHDYTESCVTSRAAEKHVRTLIQQQEMILNTVAEGILSIDNHGQVNFANPAASDILGYSVHDLTGRELHSLVHPVSMDGIAYPEGDCPICHALQHGINQKNRDGFFNTKIGKLINVNFSAGKSTDDSGQVSGSVIFFSDTTEKKKLEDELFQSHKMEAIGTLAAGIAHDFNNILVAILGYSELIKMKLPKDSNLNEDIECVLTAGKRATDLVKQILVFSRKSDQQKEVLQMSLLVQEALRLMSSFFPATVFIETDIDENVGFVRVDPTSIHQILVNLCSNALHAMGDKKGKLEITLNRVDLSPYQGEEQAEGRSVSFVDLMVSDTGHGMTDEIMDRIFDPYFTTKEVGAGTGLGLSVTHGIVKECNGFIDVQSIIGKGTVFHVYIPIAEENVELLSSSGQMSLSK